MRGRFLTVVLAGVAVMAMAGPAAAVTNLVVNGDFTNPGAGSGWRQQASIPGWFSENGDRIEVGNAGVYGATCFSTGCQVLEVNANRFGSVSQIVTGLTPGARYELGWSMAGRADSGPQWLGISVDGAAAGAMASNGFAGWTDTVHRFTAGGTSARLNFASTDVGGRPSYGNLVTNVSLGMVPEPATWAMLIAGFGMVGFAMRRRGREMVAS